MGSLGPVFFGIAIEMLVIASLAGCSGEPSARNPADLAHHGAKAELGAQYEEGHLTLWLQNTGRTPLIVDKDLVFFVHIRVFDKEGAALEMKEQGLKPRPAKDVARRRFAVLSPGERVVRLIQLDEGFVVFRGAMASRLTEAGPVPAGITAYEAIMSLVSYKALSRIEITYEADYSSRAYMRHYTDLDDKELEIYEGPLKKTILVKQGP